MGQVLTGVNVFDAAVDRMRSVYREGHRVVCTFSGGKDSGATVEICILAATLENRLPVEVMIRDEEIMVPGTYEYAERMAARPEVTMYWHVPRMPVMNICDRQMPYFWSFDPLLKPEQWVRQFPPYAIELDTLDLQTQVTTKNFPPPPGKDLVAVVAIRVQENKHRRLAIFSSGGFLTKVIPYTGGRKARPIYDWHESDVWRAFKINNWDWNRAYDMMWQVGMPVSAMRVGPPTINIYSIQALPYYAKAFPHWFQKVSDRLPGVQRVAHYGVRAIMATHYPYESWQTTFRRECIEQAPGWIAERAVKVMDKVLAQWSKMSTRPLPEVYSNVKLNKIGSWKGLTEAMYNGDPMSHMQGYLPNLHPEFFRPGSGKWEFRH